jgi:hypothetical protein
MPMRVKLMTTALALVLVGPALATAQRSMTDPMQSNMENPDISRSQPSGSTVPRGVTGNNPAHTGMDAGRNTSVAPGGNAGGAAMGTDAGGTATAATGGERWYADMRGDQIVGQTLYGADGEEIGEIDNVVLRAENNRPAAVLGIGGFLGIGARDVAIPLDDLRMGPDNRLTTNLTKDTLAALQPYQKEGYQDLDRSQSLGGANP